MIKVDMSKFDLMKAKGRQKAALLAFAHEAAQQLEGEAKKNAPWTDRTGHARQSIHGTADWVGDDLVICLSGGMEYSPYLELAHGKKYAILKPTIEKNASSIVEEYRRLVKD